MSGVDIAGLVERLRAAINLGDRTGSRGKRPENIYNVADDALTALLAQAADLAEVRALLAKQYGVKVGRAVCLVSADGERVTDLYDIPTERMPNGYDYGEEIEEATRQRDEALAALKVAEERVQGLREALKLVRGIIVEAAMTGFNCHDGDWAERLFVSQGATHDALVRTLADATNNPPSDPGTEQREAGR